MVCCGGKMMVGRGRTNWIEATKVCACWWQQAMLQPISETLFKCSQCIA